MHRTSPPSSLPGHNAVPSPPTHLDPHPHLPHLRRHFVHRLLLAFATLAGSSTALLPWNAAAQPTERITAWRASDGLPQSSALGITVGLRGRVLVTHSPSLPLALLDGYGVSSLSNSVGAPTRAHESRSGQLWCATPEGLLESTGNGWNSHPIPEIAAEYRTSPIRAIRPIPLLPLDRNRVFVVLPDRILEYDSAERRTTVVQLASETRLERFIDLGPSRDDGIWVSGRRGLLRFSGPLRQIRPDSPAEEFPLPESFGGLELQRPHQAPAGQVVLAAENLSTRERFVLRLDDTLWTARKVPDQLIRQAWTGPDGELWAHTPAALLRLEADGPDLRPRVILQAGRIADLAVEPLGTTWLATSEGVYRVAPLPWRPAEEFAPSQGAVYSVITDQRGRLVAATDRAIHWRDGTTWRSTPLPEPNAEDLSKPPDILFPLPDGGLLVHRTAGNEIASPDGTFRPASGLVRTAIPLGRLPDGRVLLHDDRQSPGELVAFDGATLRSHGPLPDAASRLGRLAFALQTRAGELWLGGERGLIVRRDNDWTDGDLPKDSTRPGVAPENSDTESDGALTALELPNGRLLVGGVDTLREFDGRRWSLIRRGLDRVLSLQLDRHGTIWVASGNGLHRFREKSWLTLGEDEGFPASAAFAVLEDGTGRLWAGTARGLAAFDPRVDPDPPTAFISSADVPERADAPRALFVVGGEDRWRFAPSGRLVFSWRLDSEPWSVWRAASAVQFTNITAGSHRFQVRAMDPSGNEQPSPANYDFEVALPWFRDPRLVASSIALALALVALVAQAGLSYLRLKRSYAEVERQVADRSAALQKANTELLHSQKMRALGTLSAGVAHDFNNLLSIIRGSAQLLERQIDDPDKARQRLQRIKTAVDQGAGLVKAMLGYSRGASAPRQLLDVPDTVLRAIRLLDEDLGGRIDYSPPPTPPPAVVASPEMLQQIVLNFLQNAAEAMDRSGHVRIRILPTRTHPRDCVLKPAPAGGYVEIAISDTGIGIPPETLTRIFEPFFTTKAFSSRRGTGLGLSMAYELAKELGAGLAVTSTVGVGSTFTIILPVPTPATP